jgi:hypothetical protein
MAASPPTTAPHTSPWAAKPPPNASIDLIRFSSCIPSFSCPTARTAWLQCRFSSKNRIAFSCISLGVMFCLLLESLLMLVLLLHFIPRWKRGLSERGSGREIFFLVNASLKKTVENGFFQC